MRQNNTLQYQVFITQLQFIYLFLMETSDTALLTISCEKFHPIIV